MQPSAQRAFSLLHSLRGLTMIDDRRLAVLVEGIRESTARVLEWEDIDQMFYLIDIETQRLESAIPLRLPGAVSLEGALSNGNVVFGMSAPESAILVYTLSR